jgi:hypothetical protein
MTPANSLLSITGDRLAEKTLADTSPDRHLTRLPTA